MISRSYGWMVTVNNPTFTELQVEKTLYENKVALLYGVVGNEGYGSPRRTPHLQIFLYFSKKEKWKYVKELFPRGHIEAMKMGIFCCDQYCKKEGCYNTFGNIEDAIEHNRNVMMQKQAVLPDLPNQDL